MPSNILMGHDVFFLRICHDSKDVYEEALEISCQQGIMTMAKTVEHMQWRIVELACWYNSCHMASTSINILMVPTLKLPALMVYP